MSNDQKQNLVTRVADEIHSRGFKVIPYSDTGYDVEICQTSFSLRQGAVNSCNFSRFYVFYKYEFRGSWQHDINRFIEDIIDTAMFFVATKSFKSHIKYNSKGAPHIEWSKKKVTFSLTELHGDMYLIVAGEKVHCHRLDPLDIVGSIKKIIDSMNGETKKDPGQNKMVQQFIY